MAAASDIVARFFGALGERDFDHAVWHVVGTHDLAGDYSPEGF